jgi:hypothetical protein
MHVFFAPTHMHVFFAPTQIVASGPVADGGGVGLPYASSDK